MATNLKHRDLLLGFYNDILKPVWARDLVGLVIKKDGAIDSKDIEAILDEINNPPESPTIDLTNLIDSPYPHVEIYSLKHVHGVKALADNQEIVFCNEGHTYLWGHNGSGKSSYFHILNQLAAGRQSYPLINNVYSNDTVCKEIVINYSVDGIKSELNWDCVSPPPGELRHIRLFDSNYADNYLSHRTGNEYIFKSYGLERFAALANTIQKLKKLNASLGVGESFLQVLYDSSYCQILIQALQERFKKELVGLGMSYLQVSLNISNLLLQSSDVIVTIKNSYDVNAILSEAEKKCVALALFFAENELLEVKQPIVFDDPVNSLDTQVVQYFVERLVKINSQIILFTHNTELISLLQEKDSNEIKIYKDSTYRRNASNKIHVLMYDIIATAPHAPGFVVNHMN